MKKKISPTEASKILGISRAAVHKAIKEGRLKARYKTVKVRVYEIDPADLDTYKVSSGHQRSGKKIN